MRPRVLALLGLPCFIVAAAQAQPHAVLSGPATCRECRIELVRVVAFGDVDGPGMLREQSVVATDSRGRFYVSSNYDPTVAVFDARGRFLTRIGRKGNGPGELRYRPTLLFGVGDTLYAMELESRRLTVFSPQYRFIRTVPLTVGGSYAVLASDGLFVVAGVARSPEGIGYPLRIMDAKGAVVRSFGSTTGEQDLYTPMDALRKIARPRGTSLWTSRVDAYVLERWSLEGKLLARFKRQVPWFPPGVPSSRRGSDEDPPAPRMRALSEDSTGLVWTLSIAADREWKPRTFPRTPNGLGRYIPDSLRHKLHDSVLELIDPARGAVLATRTFDLVPMDFIAPNLLVSFEEDANGNPRYVVWRARMVPPTTK